MSKNTYIPSCKTFLTLRLVCLTYDFNNDSEENIMTYLERTYAGVLAVTIACFGWYFTDTLISVDFATAQIADFTGRIWTMFGIYIVLVIITAIATHFADIGAEDEFDERDNTIDMISERLCSYFQAAALLGVLVLTMYEFSTFLIVHVVLAAIVITTILGLGARLYLYRRGL